MCFTCAFYFRFFVLNQGTSDKKMIKRNFELKYFETNKSQFDTAPTVDK